MKRRRRSLVPLWERKGCSCIESDHLLLLTTLVFSNRQPLHALISIIRIMSDDNMEEDRPSTSTSRRRPNILITGTPGVGKTSTAASIAVRKRPDEFTQKPVSENAALFQLLADVFFHSFLENTGKGHGPYEHWKICRGKQML